MKAYFQTAFKPEILLFPASCKLGFMDEPGDRIAEARKAKNLSRKALGNRIGVSEQAVGQWERGDIANIRLLHLIKLLPELDIDLDYLVTGKTKTPPPSTSPKASRFVQLWGEEPADLSQDESDLVVAYRHIPQEYRDAILGIIDGFLRQASPKLGAALGPRDVERARRAEPALIKGHTKKRAEIERAKAKPKSDTDSDQYGPDRVKPVVGRHAPKK